jgi:spore germination protein YaaH
MNHCKKIFIFILAAAILFSSVGAAEAKTTAKAKIVKPVPYNYLRIFYYQEGKEAKKSFTAHYNVIDVLAPQVYSLTATGTLVGSLNPDILNLAKKKKIKVMPLVTNRKFSNDVATAFLDDQVARASAIDALVAEAKKKGYWGWQVNFERVDATYQDKFSSFIADLYKVLKKNKLTLSVAVMAKTSDEPADYPDGSWNKYVGVFDYDALAPNTDFLSIMTYDDPFSAGPIARYSWIKKVLDYTVKHVPSKKISLGIPLYYWVWSNATGTRLGSGGYAALRTILNKYRTVYYYDTTYQAPRVTYKKNKKSYAIWYENGRSLQAKIDLIKQYGLGGFSAWSLGSEVPSAYPDFVKHSY